MEDQGLQGELDQPAPTTPDTTPQDDWAEAEAAYNAESDEAGQSGEEKPEQGEQGIEATPAEQPDAQPPAVTDAATEGVNLWNAEGIETPEQFKAHLKTVQAHVTKQNQAKATELKDWRESYTSVMQMVAEVARDPSQLGTILQTNAEGLAQLGIQIDPQKFVQSQPQAPQQPQPDPQAERAAFRQSIATAFSQASSSEELAEVMTNLFMQQEAKNQQVIQQIQQGVLQGVSQELKPVLDKTRRESTINYLNSEIEQLGSEIQDFERYGDQIIEYINTRPDIKSILNATIKNPQLAMRNGFTVKTLLKDIHEKVSFNDRLEAAKQTAAKERQAKISSVTEKPGPYKSTVKLKGDDWEDIEREFGSPFVFKT